jgi:hypothetical protein
MKGSFQLVAGKLDEASRPTSRMLAGWRMRAGKGRHR